jgi:1-acyl-sn-glycerol-3-phosphate acyltransferase
MSSSDTARLRLFALCFAVCARSAAFAAITLLALKVLLNHHYGEYRPGTLAAWLGLSAIPALILTSLIGPLAASRWNRTVMIGGTLVLVVVLAWAYVDANVPWLSVVGVLTLEAAFFWSTAVALAPSLSKATCWRAPVVFVGLALVALGGAALGIQIGKTELNEVDAPKYALALALVSCAAIVFVRMPVVEPLSLRGGIVRPFLAGTRDAVRERQGRSALVGLCLWFFVTLATFVVFVRVASLDSLDAERLTFHALAAVAAGVLLSALNRNPFRHAGFIPFAAVAAVIACIWLRFGSGSEAALLILGAALGAAISPLLNCYFLWTTPKYHGIAASLLIAGCCVAALVLAVMLIYLGDDPVAAREPILNVVLVVTSVAAIAAFVAFSRPALEAAAEPLLCCSYKVRMMGPGVEHLPTRGPCLVIANHAAWFDPLFIAKDLPMPVTPMMTSKFYDLPVLSWIMRNIIGTIRVPEVPFRHEAPELKEAVAALDRGACVVLFPEGYLRRKEEQPLRRFGRGVWKILADRPDTPIFACWIDGNWGSYFSYKDGPPMKYKRFDIRRRIRIGVIGPFKVDTTILADHMATRTFLMRQVAAAREPLGLEPLDLQMLPEGDKE